MLEPAIVAIIFILLMMFTIYLLFSKRSLFISKMATPYDYLCRLKQITGFENLHQQPLPKLP